MHVWTQCINLKQILYLLYTTPLTAFKYYPYKIKNAKYLIYENKTIVEIQSQAQLQTLTLTSDKPSKHSTGFSLPNIPAHLQTTLQPTSFFSPMLFLTYLMLCLLSLLLSLLHAGTSQHSDGNNNLFWTVVVSSSVRLTSYPARSRQT